MIADQARTWKRQGANYSVQQRRENQDEKYYTRLLLRRHLHGIGEYPYATRAFRHSSPLIC